MTATMELEVEDFTGQVRHRASNVPRDARVGDLIARLSSTLHLPEIDAQNRPVIYGARTSRGEVLNASDVVGDVLQENETVTLVKSVTAGMQAG
ncbi:MAG: hypothetical protein K1X74_17325 [Pirellulales bacterium]|nr:hypothetical protein [Pirellulales bacterium]